MHGYFLQRNLCVRDVEVLRDRKGWRDRLGWILRFAIAAIYQGAANFMHAAMDPLEILFCVSCTLRETVNVLGDGEEPWLPTCERCKCVMPLVRRGFQRSIAAVVVELPEQTWILVESFRRRERSSVVLTPEATLAAKGWYAGGCRQASPAKGDDALRRAETRREAGVGVYVNVQLRRRQQTRLDFALTLLRVFFFEFFGKVDRFLAGRHPTSRDVVFSEVATMFASTVY